MKSSKVFNNISDKLRAEIPKLKPGQTVVFQMLHGVPNPEPDEKERSKSPVLYGKRQVLTNFRIYDPYVKDEAGNEVGGYVDVGVVDAWNGEQPVRFRCFVPGQGEFSQFQGKFQLSAGNIRDEELYEILWLSNEREGNPHRDTSVEPLFKIINTKTDSQATVTKVDILMKALKIGKEISLKEGNEVMASLNKPVYQDEIVLRAEIMKIAKDTPDEFIAAYESKDRHIMSSLREALNQGVLSHDVATGKVSMGAVSLTTAKVEDMAELVPSLTQWIKTAKNGQDVLNNINGQLEKKNQPV